LKPNTLSLSGGARAMLVAFSDEIEGKQGKDGPLAHVTGTASKIAEQAARIAGVLTLWDDLDADQVSQATMAAAIQIARFYLGEAVRLASAAIIPPEIKRAEMLRVWLLENWGHGEIIQSEILQSGPNSLREYQVVKEAVAILLENGWLVPLPAGTMIRGKPRKHAWRIVRA
jgi:hypothetical protein